MKRPVRIVMTHVVRKPVTESGEEGVEEPFECDTFFPVEKFTAENGWRSVSTEEVTEWVGEDVTGEWKREGDVEVQMVGYERLD
jgi:dihydrofolate reductase